MAFEGPILFLTYIAVILLIGIIFSYLSNKLKITNVLFLIVAGMIIGATPFRGKPVIFFPDIFITSVSILALVMIVFDSSSRFKLSEIRAYTFPAFSPYLTNTTCSRFRNCSSPVRTLWPCSRANA